MTTDSLLIHFGALAEFKTILEKAKKQTVRELLWKTPDSMEAELVITSLASSAYGNRHLWTLMRCCACDVVRHAW